MIIAYTDLADRIRGTDWLLDLPELFDFPELL